MLGYSSAMTCYAFSKKSYVLIYDNPFEDFEQTFRKNYVVI